MIKQINKNIIQYKNNEITFLNEEIRKLEVFDDLSIIIFECGYPDKDKFYNNVIALDNEKGIIKWEIEKIEHIDKQNPYMAVFDKGAFLQFQKSNGTRYAVNKINGKVIKNIDLNTGNKPW